MNKKLFCLVAIAAFAAFPVFAEDGGPGSRLQQWRETREHRAEGKKLVMSPPDQMLTQDSYGGRDILLHVAPNVPAPGRRALVVVLHGGMGNAQHIQKTIGPEIQDAADEGGFIVAYLNGSAATKRGGKFRAWNGGGECCGQPYKQNVDDVAYITGAVDYLAGKYGVDRKKVFGMGHSNGAIMTQRLMCETDLYQAAIPVSGPLNIDVAACPAAKDKRIWAIHGERDENLPVGGGFGTKGVTNINFKSQQYSQHIFEESGADYTLDILPGVDHGLKNISLAIEKREGRTFGREAALFFGLAPK